MEFVKVPGAQESDPDVPEAEAKRPGAEGQRLGRRRGWKR